MLLLGLFYFTYSRQALNFLLEKRLAKISRLNVI